MTEPAAKPRRRWRRWLLRGAVALLVARLLLALFLPQVIAFAASWYGVDVAMRSASLSLTGLAVQADDIVVRQTGDPTAPPLLAAHGFIADLSLAHLLVGDLVLVDAAMSGAIITVQRRTDGTLHLPPGWQQQAAPTTAATTPSPPLQFAAPLSIVSLRLHDVVVRVEDEGAPGQAWSARLDVEVAEFGRRDRPGVVLVRVHQPAWFDAAWLRAEARLQPEQLDVSWEAALRGVRVARMPLPEPVSRWLADARVLDATLGGTLHAKTGAGAKVAEFSTVLRGNVQADETERLALTAAIGPGPMQSASAGWPFTFELKAPGLVERIRVEDGHIAAADGGSVHARCQVDDLTLQRVQPWLASRGLTVPPSGLDLQCHVAASGGPSWRASLDDFAADGGGERLTIGHAAVHGLQLDDGGMRIARVELDHVAATLAGSATGGVRALGLALHAPTSSSTALAPPPPPIATLPRLRIDALAVGDVTATWRDERTTPARQLTATLTSLVGEGLATGNDGPPGTLRASLHIPDAVGSVQVLGTVQSDRSTMQTDLQITGDGITLAALRPWLAPAGIEPTLRHGALALTATAGVTLAEHGIAVATKLVNVRLLDGDDVLVSLRSLDGSGLRFDRDALELGDWHLREPFATLRRFPDRTEVAGLAFGTARTTVDPTASPADSKSAARPFALPGHGTLAIERAGLQLIDGDEAPLVLGFDLSLGRADPTTATTPLQATVRADGIVQEATLAGTLRTDAGLGLEATLQAQGLRGAGLARLLPSHLGCTLVDGSLQAQLTARVPAMATEPTELRLDEFTLRDREAELAAVRRLHGSFTRPDADHVAFTTLRLEGVRALLARTEDGLHVPGFVVRPTPPAANAAVATGAPPPPTRQLPIVSVDDLAFDLERLVFRDRTHGDGEPLVVAANGTAEPWHPSTDGDSPPLHLRGGVRVEPLLRELTFDATLDPYATKPTLGAHLRAAGLDPSALARVLPGLAGRIDGTTTDASCAADLHVTIDLGRRDGRSLPGDRPIGGEVVLDDVVLRDDVAGTDLLRIGTLDVNARAIDPRTGDVLLRSVHLDDCKLAAAVTADGIEGLGVRVRAAATPTATPAAAPLPTNGGTARSPEFAIDRLHATGLDLAFCDRTTAPPTLLPIVDGTLTVRSLTTAPDDHSPAVGFALHLHGGPVPLEKRIVRSSMFAGVLGSAVDAIGGAADRHDLEPRALIDELEVVGELQPRPPLRGRVQATIAGFELAALRGLANRAGIDITDGVLDQSLRLELRGHDGIDVATRPVFTWLSLTEPPGGPISTYLRLPAPLDSVLFLLRNDDDEHRLPVNLHFPAAGLSPSTMRESIAEAVLRVVTAAVAGSASRAASAFTGALGLHGNDDLPAPVAFAFAPGDPAPVATDVRTLLATLRADPTLELLLVHELGAADLDRTASLTSPPAATIATEVQRLRTRKAELGRQRTPLQEETTALFAAGRLHEARVRQRELATLTTDLGELEHTLEAMLAMLTGDTARAAARRSQQAAVELAQNRLLTVRTVLRLAEPTLAAGRIRTKSPRGVPTADLPLGGRVVASFRRRKGQ